MKSIANPLDTKYKHYTYEQSLELGMEGCLSRWSNDSQRKMSIEMLIPVHDYRDDRYYNKDPNCNYMNVSCSWLHIQHIYKGT